MAYRDRRYITEEDLMGPAPVKRRSLGERLMSFLIGIVLGVVVTGALLAYPDTLVQAQEEAVRTVQSMSEEQRIWVFGVAGVFALLVLILLRQSIMRSTLLLGMILGIIAWVPFGRHMLAYVPQVGAQAPLLAPTLDTVVARYPTLQGVRAWGERTVEVPAAAVPAATGAGTTTAADG